jgi:hypothetical protein
VLSEGTVLEVCALLAVLEPPHRAAPGRRVVVNSPSGRGAHFDYNRVDNCSSRERISTTIARSQLAFRAGSARLSLLQPRRQLRLSLR